MFYAAIPVFVGVVGVDGPLTHLLPLVEVQVDRPHVLHPSDLGDELQGGIHHLLPARLDAQPDPAVHNLHVAAPVELVEFLQRLQLGHAHRGGLHQLVQELLELATTERLDLPAGEGARGVRLPVQPLVSQPPTFHRQTVVELGLNKQLYTVCNRNLVIFYTVFRTRENILRIRIRPKNNIPDLDSDPA